MARVYAALILAVVCGNVGHACNVPVFRYALERWRNDPYQITLFYRAPLTEEQRELAASLEEKQDNGVVNLVVQRVNVDKIDNADRALFEALGEDPALPRLVMQYPPHLRMHKPIWSGPLDKETVSHLSDSPVRKALVSRLSQGQTAVWLLIESGDAAKDEPAAARVQEEIKKLEQQLKLPELTTAPEDNLLAGPPLKVAFSLLRVPRSEAEQPLLQMLLRSEPDLPDRTDPMVFPVFGRGRALFGLVGAGITAENIFDSASFLVGPCSCQVKELNPGFDLLLTADWDRIFTPEGTAAAAFASREPPADTEPVLLPIPTGSAPSAQPMSGPPMAAMPTPVAAPRFSFARLLLLLIGGVAVLALVLICAIAAAKSQSRPA